MSRKKIPHTQALIDALRELDGNMAAVARRFHVSRQRVWGLVHEDPQLVSLVDDMQESFKDEAENKLFELIREGNPAAVIFYMKTKCRDRGYSERLELLPLSRQDIEVELGHPTAIENREGEALECDSPAIALLEQ